MLLQDFSGGINTRIAPSLIAPNEAQVLLNVDASSGSIVPIKDKLLHTLNINKYFTYYYANSEIFSKVTETSYVEYRDKLYMTNFNSYPTKYDGTNEYRLGIVAPDSVPVVTPVTDPTFNYALAINWIGGDLPIGAYNFILVYKVATVVSKIIRTSITLADIDDAVRINFTASSVPDIYREYNGVYRLVTAGATGSYYDDIVLDISANAVLPDISNLLDGSYTYVYTYYNSVEGVESRPSTISSLSVLSNETVTITFNDVSIDPQVDKIRLYRSGGDLASYTLITEFSNVAVSYLDNNTDISIAGNNILDSITYKEAPTGLKYLTEAYAMLFGASGDKLYYSNIALPNAWPATNFLDFASPITGIGAVQNGLLVFTKFKTFIVTGNSPDTFSKYLVSSSQGCINHYTIQFLDGLLIWVSQDGVCSSNGGSIEVITMQKLGKVALTNTLNAQILDRVYYLALTDGLLILDFRFNFMIRKSNIVVDWIGSYLDSLYCQTTSNLYEAFTATTNLTYHYKSGLLTEGAYSNYKTFKDFYIKYNGDVQLKLYVDGTLVNTINLTGDDCYNLKALSASSGYGIEIELTGTAEVSEIQYTVLGRQNGK